MFGLGITTWAGAAVAVLALGWGGVQNARMQSMALRLEKAQTAASVAQGSLLTCSLRLTNLQEAAESNATIPDNLTDFDIPLEWMLGATNPDTPTD
jgi:hypothetical protein